MKHNVRGNQTTTDAAEPPPDVVGLCWPKGYMAFSASLTRGCVLYEDASLEIDFHVETELSFKLKRRRARLENWRRITPPPNGRHALTNLLEFRRAEDLNKFIRA